MIPTRKIKKLILSIKKILNNHIQIEFTNEELSVNLISINLIVSEFIETRNWLQKLEIPIKRELKRAFWEIYLNKGQFDFDFKFINNLNEKLSNEFKNTISEIFEKETPFSTENIFLNDPILTDIQILSNIIQYFHFLNDDHEEDNTRKASGSYYTPPSVILYILNRLKSDILMKLVRSDNIRILDYSCGMGAFLIYAAAFVSFQNFKNVNFSFWGFDYDPYIIKICNYLLKLLTFHPGFSEMFQKISFVHADSLESLTEIQWKDLLRKNSQNNIKIPSNFNEEIVDIIITNPPYKSWGLGRVGTLKNDNADKYRKIFSTAEYKISYYALFIERAIQFLKPGGWGAFVLPDSFLMGKYYQKLRSFLLSKSILLEICLFEKNFWSQANSGLPVILILQKISGDTNQLEVEMRSIKCIFRNNEVFLLQEYKMNPKFFQNQPKKRFRLFFSKDTENFTTKFEKNTIPLKNYFEIHHGIRSKTGIGKERITSRMKKNHYWKRGLISGNSIVPYLIHYQGHFIMVKPDMLFSGGFNPTHIEQEKIILRRTGDRLIAAVDTDGFYHSNTLLYLIPRKDVNSPISLYALCTILNSIIFNRFYQLITLKKNRTLPQVEIDTLNELPLKINKHIIQQLDGVGRILHRIRRTNQIHPLNEEDQKDIDELLYLIEKTVENLYLE
nr:hypothetical protein DSAG12_00411 [Candidatus Prometheoarchaeum syntrophicum]